MLTLYQLFINCIDDNYFPNKKDENNVNEIIKKNIIKTQIKNEIENEIENEIGNERINIIKFKDKYLHINKKYTNENLLNYLTKIIKKDSNKLFKYIYPYINEIENQIFIDNSINTKIEYSNKLKLYIKKELLTKYIKKLSKDKIIVDIKRIRYTKKFIKNFIKNSKHNKILEELTKPEIIYKKNYKYLKENKLYYYKYGEIYHKKTFLNNIIKSNKYIKYLMHQDIHNSIINPILTTIMISKYIGEKLEGEKKEDIIIQFNNIEQIYNKISEDATKLEMFYKIDKFFIYYPNRSELPKKKIIEPELIIKIKMIIKETNIIIKIIY